VVWGHPPAVFASPGSPFRPLLAVGAWREKRSAGVRPQFGLLAWGWAGRFLAWSWLVGAGKR
jgi:hypothetical protein